MNMTSFNEYQKEIKASSAIISTEPTDEHKRQVSEWLISKGYRNREEQGFSEIVKYLCRLSKGMKKGLLLIGGNGSGKTAFFKAAFPKVSITPATDITFEWKKEGEYETMQRYCSDDYYSKLFGVSIGDSRTDMVFDDVGAEPIINDYGTKIQVISEILQGRYNKWQRDFSLTHITTNLDAQRFSETYGARVLSRVSEMCIPVVLSCGDARLEVM